MITGIRSPAEVIALVLEEYGIEDHQELALNCAKRLSTALRTTSTKGEQVIIRRQGMTLEWATLHTTPGA